MNIYHKSINLDGVQVCMVMSERKYEEWEEILDCDFNLIPIVQAEIERVKKFFPSVKQITMNWEKMEKGK